MPGDSRPESSSSHEVSSQRVETPTQRYGFERPDEVSQKYLDFKKEMRQHYTDLKEKQLEMTDFTEVYKESMQYAAEGITQVSSSETQEQIYKKLESLALQAQKEVYVPPPQRGGQLSGRNSS